MKAAFVLFLFCAVFALVYSVPQPGDEVDQPVVPTGYPWYNPYSYQYMMCRLRCRQSCLEQGYYKGVCKQGECVCFGPMGPFGRNGGFYVPNY